MPYDSSSAAGAILAASGFVLIVSLAAVIFAIIIYWRIASKAGYNGAMSLLLLIPIVNLIILIMFAFSEWPIQKELNQLRAMAGRGGPGSPFPSSPQYPGYGQPQYGQPGQPPQYPQPGQPQYPQPGQPGQQPQYPQR